MRLFAILALCLSVAPAAAQNIQCPNRPTGDSTNACANTRFVSTFAGTLGTMAFQNANAVAITGGSIVGMPNPTVASAVATKAYVDSLSSGGFHVVGASIAATTTVLPNSPTYSNGTAGVGATLTAGSNGALTVDGIALTANQRVIVKDQSAALQNGIYQLSTVGDGSTPYVLTRTTDADTPAELSNAYSLVEQGTTNGSSGWVSGTVATIGTDAVDWTKFSTPPTDVSTATFTATGGTTSQTVADGFGNLPTVEQYGAIGYAYSSGSCASGAGAATDSTTAITNALNSGQVVRLSPNRCYKITSAVIGTTSNSGLVGDGTATIFMPNTSFDYANPNVTSYGTNANGLMIQGQVTTPFTAAINIRLCGLRIQYETTSSERWVNAIMVRNITNATICNNEIYGFASGDGIQADSVQYSSIEGNYIHDFTDNNNWGVGNASPAPRAIRVDNDLFNTSSFFVNVKNNRVHDITVGSTYIAAAGYQADGIRIQRATAIHIIVSGNDINNTGQGIDDYSQQGIISNNSIRNTYNFGIALKYNGSTTLVSQNSIIATGLGGIILSPGSAETGSGTMEFISVVGNTILGVNDNGAWTGQNSACLLIFADVDSTFKAKNNMFTNNMCHPSGGAYAVNTQSTGPNYFTSNFLDSGASGVILNPGDTGVVFPGLVGSSFTGPTTSSFQAIGGIVTHQ